MTCSECKINRVPVQCETFGLCPPCANRAPQAIAYRDAQSLPMRQLECEWLSYKSAFVGRIP